MNPRPILIATCCAIALVAFVYFYGQQYFSLDGTSDRTTPHPKPVTVNKSPTTSESPLTHSPQPRYSTETSSKVAVENSSAPSADTGEFRAALDSAIQTDPSLSENFKERVRLFNAFNAMMDKIDSYVEPDEKDFENQDDYYDALIEYLEVTEPLHEQAYKLNVQYLRISYTPKEFEKMASLFREQARDHSPDITDEDIESLIEEFRPR